MQAPSAHLQNHVLLLKGRRLRVMSEGDSRLIIRSTPSWIYASLMAVCVVLSVFLVLLSGMMIVLGLFPPKPDPIQDWMALALGIPCTLVFIGLHAATVYLLLTLALPRVTVIDLSAQTIRIRHIPWLPRELPLADVVTVDLVMFAKKGTCHLGFTDCSAGALHSIHWLGGEFDTATANRDALLPAARLIARFIDKPLESSWGAIGWKFYKGAPEPLPAE